MAEGIKISEFETINSLKDGCCIPVVSDGKNKRVLKSSLFSQFLNEILSSGSMTQKLRETIPVGFPVIDVDNPATKFGYGTWGGGNLFGTLNKDSTGNIIGFNPTYVKVGDDYQELKIWVRIS